MSVRNAESNSMTLDSPVSFDPLDRLRHRPSECKGRDLRAYSKPNALDVAQSGIDVESAAVAQIDLAPRVAAVLDRQDGGRQEGRLALSAMRVPAQNPAAV